MIEKSLSDAQDNKHQKSKYKVKYSIMESASDTNSDTSDSSTSDSSDSETEYEPDPVMIKKTVKPQKNRIHNTKKKVVFPIRKHHKNKPIRTK